jgi:hypothetical protein
MAYTSSAHETIPLKGAWQFDPIRDNSAVRYELGVTVAREVLSYGHVKIIIYTDWNRSLIKIKIVCMYGVDLFTLQNTVGLYVSFLLSNYFQSNISEGYFFVLSMYSGEYKVFDVTLSVYLWESSVAQSSEQAPFTSWGSILTSD